MHATADSQPRLIHQGFAYSSRGEFVSRMVPFVREGRERGDPVLAVTSPDNIDALRESLGPQAAEVDFRDATEWYQQPYRTLHAYERYVDEHAGDRVVRVIGEPVWHGRSPAAIREWTRYESVINAAFASSPAWIICPYATASLPPEVIEHSRHTHPEVIGPEGLHSSDVYEEPEKFVEALRADPAPRPPADAIKVVFDGSDYAELRAVVAGEASRSGLSRERIDELVLAATELATNAVMYGRPPMALFIWRDGDELACQVEDSGTGFADRLIGFSLPPACARGGRGLWIVRQFCDSVDIVRGEGFAVRVRVAAAATAA